MPKKLVSIPCIIYTEIDDPAPGGATVEQEARAMMQLWDDGVKTVIRPTTPVRPMMDQQPRVVESYNTPPGQTVYLCGVKLEYEDDSEVEEDDAKAGIYLLKVYARNAFEASEAALDQWHNNHPISNLDNAQVTVTEVKRDDGPLPPTDPEILQELEKHGNDGTDQNPKKFQPTN